MAKGLNAQRTNGKEWWGKRPLSMTSVSRKHGMKKAKRHLHKIERKQAKKIVNYHIYTDEEIKANRPSCYGYIM
jgi:hypothetical protein